MAYRKGDLKLTSDPDGPGPIFDSRVGYGATVEGAYLPHSCDEWYVGGIPELKALIADAQEAINRLLEHGHKLPPLDPDQGSV